MSENLALNLIDSAQRGAEQPAVRLDHTVLSYGALDDLTARVAGLLRARGVAPGDRVGLMLPNVPQFAVAYYGILRAGAIVVPMNVLLKRREVAFYLGDPGAKLVFAWHEFAAEAEAGAAEAGAECIIVRPGDFEQVLAGATPAREIADRVGSDTAVILYTSGTTGRPKGAELTHANLRRNVEVMTGIFSIGPEDVVLGALPLFHAFGQTCALNAAIAAGGCLSLIARFDAGTALEIIERDRVNVFEGVPTMYSALLSIADSQPDGVSPDSIRSLRTCVSGGAALPVQVLADFEKAFGCTVLEGYGLSESSPAAAFNHPHRERKVGSIGTPIDGIQMRIVDLDGVEVPQGQTGEIQIRGHNVMKGYWNLPDATKATITTEGWLNTGDVGRVDEDGYFYIVDRTKDMIIRGGYNVYPREIEEVLYAHPVIREAAVIGKPDERLGEEVVAIVVLDEGASLSEAEIIAYCRERLAAYKYPREVRFMTELPKGPSGKILKTELRDNP